MFERNHTAVLNLAACADWVADDCEAGKLQPGSHQLYNPSGPNCAIGHVLHRAKVSRLLGDWVLGAYTQVKAVEDANDGADFGSRPWAVVAPLRALAQSLRDEVEDG